MPLLNRLLRAGETKLVKRLGPAERLVCCYEARPCGDGLQRQLTGLGAACTVVGPSVIEKIIDGKMGKFYGGVCLTEQAFIKNPDQTIRQLLEEKGKALGENLTIRRFIRYMVGEAISS